MNSHSVLIVEDELRIRQFLRVAFESEGCKVFEAATLASGLAAAGDCRPNLIVLDLGLPDGDGLDFIRTLRSWSDVLILVLSARHLETDKVAALDAGADDYLTKPFRLTTLLMRVKSLLRRMDMNTKKVTGQELSDIKIGNLRFSAQENCLYCKGKPVSLSKTELKMLTYMLKEPKKAFSREEILEGVWGFDTEVETRVTDETLRRIRRKLSLAGSNVSIGTIWGFGYRISIAEDKK